MTESSFTYQHMSCEFITETTSDDEQHGTLRITMPGGWRSGERTEHITLPLPVWEWVGGLLAPAVSQPTVRRELRDVDDSGIPAAVVVGLSAPAVSEAEPEPPKGGAYTVTVDQRSNGVLIDGADHVLEPLGGIWLRTTEDVQEVHEELGHILRDRGVPQAEKAAALQRMMDEAAALAREGGAFSGRLSTRHPSEQSVPMVHDSVFGWVREDDEFEPERGAEPHVPTITPHEGDDNNIVIVGANLAAFVPDFEDYEVVQHFHVTVTKPPRSGHTTEGELVEMLTTDVLFFDDQVTVTAKALHVEP